MRSLRLGFTLERVRSLGSGVAVTVLLGGLGGCGQLTGLSALSLDGNDAALGGGSGSDGGSGAQGDDATSSEPDAAAPGDDATVIVPPGDDAGGTGDSAPSDTGAPVIDSAPPPTCKGTGGPALVKVTSFCIDATEVTNAQYAAFLATNPPASLAPSPECAYATSFTPSSQWPAAANKASMPVVWVDWCDAYAFCAWSGKHLCGAIGGGSSSKANAANKAVDEWYVACSMDGANVYPYGGNSYVQGKCNDSASGANALRAVASFTGCEGGYSGIFDMNGNAYEWTDACDVAVGASDSCMIRGGSWDFTGTGYGGCNTYFNDYVVKRSDTFNDTSFRCCDL